MRLKYKKLTTTAKTPIRGSAQAAGLDLYADMENPISIWPGSRPVEVKTGIAVEIPEGYYGVLALRSSMGKKGLMMPHGVGIIDSDYRSDVMFQIANVGGKIETIYPHKRIGQIIIQKYENVDLEEVDELSETERGAGGFGSTGER